MSCTRGREYVVDILEAWIKYLNNNGKELKVMLCARVHYYRELCPQR